ncbi:MAG: ATP-binding protein [Lachnospiraceae bacterium]|nr:ATP-binding protein [Lachnospiraceae bacterium]
MIVTGVLLLALIITTIIFIFTIIRYDDIKRVNFLLLIACVWLYILGYGFEVNSLTREASFISHMVMYFGACFVAPFYLLFILDFAEIRVRRWVTICLLSIAVTTLVVALLSPFHQLYYLEYWVSDVTWLTHFDFNQGPLYMPLHLMQYLCVAIAIFILAYRFLKAPAFMKRQALLLLISALLPAFGNILFALRLNVMGGLNLTPMSLVASMALFYIAITKFNLFDLVPLASKQALKLMNEAVIILDYNRNVLDSNPAAAKIFPDLRDIRERADGQLSISDITHWPEELTAALDLGTAKQGVEFSQHGEITKHYQASLTTIYAKEKMRGWLVLIYDITNVSKLLHDFEAVAKDEAAANKAKSSFLANMSHEIRTPMNAILGISEIELDRKETPPETKESLHKIYNSGHILLGIINDILDMSKIEAGKLSLNPAEYDVANLIHETVQLNLTRIGSKEIDFIVEADEKLPERLVGDELRIKQILNNLLSNAFKYTEKGYIRLSIDYPVPEILSFTVEDTGQGIKEESLGKLFSVYTRFNEEANRATEGTGIGLNITKSLVEMMEGSINVKSEYGSGSIFSVEIIQECVPCQPIGLETAEKLNNFMFYRQKERSSISPETMPYGKVLVVDDIDTNLYVAQGLLSPYQLLVETADSGQRAIELVSCGQVYDVIFMDHMMPGMDGIEACKILREKGYQGTVIALTANAIVGNDKMFRENGFDDYLSKPIDLKQLNAILNKWVRDMNPEEAEKNLRKANGDIAPAEKNIYTQAEDMVYLNYQDSLAPLNAIEDFDADEALTAMGGNIEVYLNSIKITKKLLPERIEKMDAYIADHDDKSFTILAHGLKSALKNIGATALSILAAELEMMAMEDTSFEESYAKFRAGLCHLSQRLDEIFPEQAKEAGELKTLLNEAAEALEFFDCETALAKIKELEMIIDG